MSTQKIKTTLPHTSLFRPLLAQGKRTGKLEPGIGWRAPLLFLCSLAVVCLGKRVSNDFTGESRKAGDTLPALLFIEF